MNALQTLTRCLTGLALLLLAACSKDSPGPTSLPPAVASVTAAPTTSSLTVGDTVRLVATVKDAAGNVLTDRVVTWASTNPAVATGSGTGLVTGVRADAQPVMITATSETVSGSAGVTVTAPEPTVSFATIEAAAFHTCGRTAAGAAYCWGDNGAAQLGIGALSPPNATTPQGVSGGLTLASVSVGGVHACGLTAGGTAYCWGGDLYGGLGGGAPGPEICTGSTPCSSAPLAVAGGLTFSSLSAGWGPTCAVTANGSAYCWGDNLDGALGVGADTGTVQSCSVGPCSYTPLAVAGGLAFTTLGAGNFHACGLTSRGAAYCWGENVSGQLGDGTTTNSLTPVAVAGGLTFATLSPFISHTCGLTTGGVGYCWGSNSHGELGDRTTTSSTVPVRVAGQPGAAAAGARQVGAGRRTMSEPAAVLRMLPP